ncbi:hypothetical protein ACFWSF_39700 [Streptomyces sp. NPDC058611]|uniref:hypothetical protein n=1 Tax=unclassified Streptomyces TaxID=2593676 RepID=UPI0036665EEA
MDETRELTEDEVNDLLDGKDRDAGGDASACHCEEGFLMASLNPPATGPWACATPCSECRARASRGSSVT